MRPYVEPPPTLRCMCGSELRLKLIEPADRTHGKQREIFVCINCGREQALLADGNPYVASAATCNLQAAGGVPACFKHQDGNEDRQAGWRYRAEEGREEQKIETLEVSLP